MASFMQTYDVTLISLTVLIIILIAARIKNDRFSFSSVIVKMIVITSIIGLILESITWYIEFKPGALNYHLGFITNSLALLCGAVVSAFWISYWDYKFNHSKKKVSIKKFYLYPIFIQFILLVFNRFTKSFFYIEQGTNAFVDTPLYFILYVFYLIYFVYLIQLIHKRTDKSDNKLVYASLLFMMFPAISVIVQFILPELIFSWSSLTISALLVYLFLETASGNIDVLTNLYSRRLLELYLQSLIEDKKEFYALMVDLDHFKDVNDIYGHSTGDQVLIRFAEILRKTSHNNDIFLARQGGDEFFIIIKNDLDINPNYFIDLIKDQWSQETYFQKFPFLSFSAGFIAYDDSMTIDDVLNVSDKKMYQQKIQK